MSLLTITSHHYAHRSHNLVSFHHAQPIERQIPASAHNHVFAKHGTRVTVRNLFGNMPVRVKQRTLVADQKIEQHRLRQVLEREMVGLLLSSQSSVSLKIRDGDNKTIANFNTLNATVAGHTRNTATDKPTSAHLSSLLQIMTQANYIAVDEWASWVPVSASTPVVTVKGAISLDPAPNKYTQFISVGMRPLSAESRGNELYNQVNRLFALSDFGSVEDDDVIDEQEQLRRLSDKRFKKDGFTNRQLKTKKGVDRCPMFHLRASFKDRRTTSATRDRFIEDESGMQAVMDVFTAMITQWLSVHHFRPRKLHTIDRPKATSASPRSSTKSTCISPSKRPTPPGTPHTLVEKGNEKRRRLATALQEPGQAKSRSKAFADWSRIKSGRSSFFEPTGITQKSRAFGSTQDMPSHVVPDSDALPRFIESSGTSAPLYVTPIAKGTLGDATSPASSNTEIETSPFLDDRDGTMSWTDPSTGKTYLLNARTGCVVSSQRPRTNPSALTPSITRFNTNKSLRMAPRPATVEPAKTPWLDDIIQNWENPIFKPTEQRVQQISLQYDTERMDTCHPQHSHTHSSTCDVSEAFDDTGPCSARLSKDALCKAEVISQVDKKFILVRMASSPKDRETQSTADVLVLIDQHAADERIKVESLLDELCSPGKSSTQPDYRSKLGFSSLVKFAILETPVQFAVSPQEQGHFEAFASSFAAWGILYDSSSTASTNNRTNLIEVTNKISITALPPAISERCKADPQLLIGFLRSAIWRYVESPPLVPDLSSDQHTSWVKRIGTCPPGLIDLVNSRACRSAIMFNDELSLVDCTVLVRKLADCVFPFMCAHGRPSMVPIVDLGKVGTAGFAFGATKEGKNTTFVEAWKKWNR
jgi:DNA mismatch repair protein MLH3